MSQFAQLQSLIPGSKIPGDWFDAVIPENISVGSGCMIDSSFCFKHYYPRDHVGLTVGDDVSFWRTSIAVEVTGSIQIGNQCYLANASLVCTQQIRIGDRVFVAGGVTIVDSDFHPLDPATRLADTIALSPQGDRERRPQVQAMPVVIGDDVCIAYNATVLKGVSIGDGAFVGPGAVVLRDVAAGARVFGNPARELTEEKHDV